MHYIDPTAAGDVKDASPAKTPAVNVAISTPAIETISVIGAIAERIAEFCGRVRSVDPDEAFKLVIREAPDILQAGWVALCFPRNGSPMDLIRKHTCPCPNACLLMRKEAIAAIESRQAYCGEGSGVCARFGGLSPCVIIPLVVGGLPAGDGCDQDARHGYLCACNFTAPSDPPELLRLKGVLLADMLSAALTRSNMRCQALLQSELDPLTGLAARRSMEDKLNAEHLRSIRYNNMFCVVIMDIDDFKSANETFGQAAGDRLLTQLAKALNEQIRSSDVLSRYGSDEFVLLMTETKLPAASAVAERLRKTVESIITPAGKPMTISLGVAEWAGLPADSAASVFRRADAALYKAKNAGKNRVEVA